MVTNLAAFGVVWLVGREVGSDDLDAYAGLGKRNPGIALAMLVALLIPGWNPAAERFYWQAARFRRRRAIRVWSGWPFVGVATSIVGLYYYLNIMKILYRPGADERPLSMERSWRVALLVCVVAMVALGTILAPWYNLSAAASSGWF